MKAAIGSQWPLAKLPRLSQNAGKFIAGGCEMLCMFGDSKLHSRFEEKLSSGHQQMLFIVAFLDKVAPGKKMTVG